MAENCDYANQLREASSLVATAVGIDNWELVYQSRSGPPGQPWLGPDVCDYLDYLGMQGTRYVVLSPIGFISDHMEVIYDLDVQAKKTADGLGIRLARAATAGTHPQFVKMIRELMLERIESAPARFLGDHGASHDVCESTCCLSKDLSSTSKMESSRG
jgi:ferrochelatase